MIISYLRVARLGNTTYSCGRVVELVYVGDTTEEEGLVPGPDGRLISTQERMQQVKQQQEGKSRRHHYRICAVVVTQWTGQQVPRLCIVFKIYRVLCGFYRKK